MKAFHLLAAFTTILHTAKQAEGDLACPKRSLREELTSKPAECPWLHFPTGNTLEDIDPSRLHGALDEALAPNSRRPLVTFFYGKRCPYSRAWRPVVECTAKFFPPHVRFMAINSAAMSSSTRLNLGILSTPILRISWQGHRTRYGGDRELRSMVKAISQLTGDTASFDARAFEECSSDPSCECQEKAAEVTAADIAELGRNYWMLAAVIFLAVVALQYAWERYLKRSAHMEEGQQHARVLVQ